MNIRRAENKDIPDVLNLLSQVLEVHAKIRPDIFVPGTTKYGREELEEMFGDECSPVYVACEDDRVRGYAFCQIRTPAFSSTMLPGKTMFIDDLCVDENARGGHIGKRLFDHVKSEAERLGCSEITLNVWEGNDAAKAFYDAMGMKARETQMEFILRDRSLS